MDFDLILEILSNVINQEDIALLDELLVEWIIDWVSFDSILDEEHCKVFDSKVTQKPLIFRIDCIFFLLEK